MAAAAPPLLPLSLVAWPRTAPKKNDRPSFESVPASIHGRRGLAKATSDP